MTPSFSLPKGPHILDVSGVNSIRAFSMERVQQPDSAHPLFLSPMSNRYSPRRMRSSKCN
jgi:hypothetical protein